MKFLILIVFLLIMNVSGDISLKDKIGADLLMKFSSRSFNVISGGKSFIDIVALEKRPDFRRQDILVYRAIDTDNDGLVDQKEFDKALDVISNVDASMVKGRLISRYTLKELRTRVDLKYCQKRSFLKRAFHRIFKRKRYAACNSLIKAENDLQTISVNGLSDSNLKTIYKRENKITWNIKMLFFLLVALISTIVVGVLAIISVLIQIVSRIFTIIFLALAIPFILGYQTYKYNYQYAQSQVDVDPVLQRLEDYLEWLHGKIKDYNDKPKGNFKPSLD